MFSPSPSSVAMLAEVPDQFLIVDPIIQLSDSLVLNLVEMNGPSSTSIVLATVVVGELYITGARRMIHSVHVEVDRLLHC